jgi:hypothetical protein
VEIYYVLHASRGSNVRRQLRVGALYDEVVSLDKKCIHGVDALSKNPFPVILLVEVPYRSCVSEAKLLLRAQPM